MSLSVEEWFYIILPVILIFLRERHFAFTQSVLVCVVLFLILSFASRYLLFMELESIDLYLWDVIFRKRVECRIDSLMIGVMGGLIYFKYNRLIVEIVLIYF